MLTVAHGVPEAEISQKFPTIWLSWLFSANTNRTTSELRRPDCVTAADFRSTRKGVNDWALVTLGDAGREYAALDTLPIAIQESLPRRLWIIGYQSPPGTDLATSLKTLRKIPAFRGDPMNPNDVTDTAIYARVARSEALKGLSGSFVGWFDEGARQWFLAGVVSGSGIEPLPEDQDPASAPQIVIIVRPPLAVRARVPASVIK